MKRGEKMGHRIMVVDDEPTTTDTVAKLLETKGYEPVKAYSGKQCFERLRKKKVDLIILDIMMPKMNGWEVLERLKKSENYKSIPVILLTVKTYSIDKMLGISVFGAVDYIEKPFKKEVLLQRIKTALESRLENEYW